MKKPYEFSANELASTHSERYKKSKRRILDHLMHFRIGTKGKFEKRSVAGARGAPRIVYSADFAIGFHRYLYLIYVKNQFSWKALKTVLQGKTNHQSNLNDIDLTILSDHQLANLHQRTADAICERLRKKP